MGEGLKVLATLSPCWACSLREDPRTCHPDPQSARKKLAQAMHLTASLAAAQTSAHRSPSPTLLAVTPCQEGGWCESTSHRPTQGPTPQSSAQDPDRNTARALGSLQTCTVSAAKLHARGPQGPCAEITSRGQTTPTGCGGGGDWTTHRPTRRLGNRT